MRGVRATAVLTGLALAAVYIVWGSTFLAIAVSLESIPPLLLMGVRSTVAGAILYGAARAMGASRPEPGAWRNALVVGVLFFVIGHGLLAWGETRVPSGAAAVMIATEPMFIVLLGWRGGLLTGRPPTARPSARVFTAVGLGLGGVAAMMLPRSGGTLDALGLLALLAASFSWSVGTFRVAAAGSPLRTAGMQLLSGGGILLLLSTMIGELNGLSATSVTARSVGALAYLIVFGSVVTFGAYIWLLRRIGPARLATHTFVNPLIALALGAWLGGEVLGMPTLIASGLVLAAVMLLLTSPSGERERRRAGVRAGAAVRLRKAA